MLNLILGRIGSGKTTEVFNKIESLVSEGSDVLLIVPEQYSFYSEKNVLDVFGAQKADKIDVVSFSFFARNILKKYGLNTKKLLDDSTRAMLMSLALEGVGDKLNVYGKHRQSAAVISQMMKIVKELRQCSVSPEMIAETADKMDDSVLKSKLTDINMIMTAYTAISEQSYFDDECALDVLHNVLCEHNDLENKTVFIDGFRGFTSQELKVLEVVLQQAKETYITLCSDAQMNSDDFCSFAHTRRTMQKLINIANKNNVRVAKPQIIEEYNEKRYAGKDLEVLEKGLYSDEYEVFEGEPQSIEICSAEDFKSECEYIAHTVKKLLREENMRCRDIAIISRSEENYARQIRSELKKNGVPVFVDRRQPIASQPLIEFVCSAVEIASNGFSEDSVMRVLKTGLTDLNIDEISELENYALMWQINSNKWLDTWTGHPNGLGEKMHEKDVEELKKINDIRIKAVAPLQKFRVSFKDINGLTAAKAVYKLLCDFNVAANLKKTAMGLDERGESKLASQQERVWEIVIEILDRIAGSLESVSLTSKRFGELLNLIVSTYTLGTLPQGLDEILIGSADRVKTTSPKIVFAVGVNDGLFPMIPTSGGILSDNDRKILADYDLKMDDNFEQKIMEEHFIAYSTVCSPSQKLYVTYSRKGASGEQLSPSEIVLQIKKLFPDIKTFDTLCTPETDFIQADEPAFELMARLSEKGGKMYSALREYFKNKPEYNGKIQALDRCINKKEFSIDDKETAKELFGKNMYMSASRTEVYHKCPFEYFCKFGLNAQPRKTAELDPMQKGTAMHYILEKLISAYGSDGLCKMSKEERDKCVWDVLEEYYKEAMDSGNNMGERFEFLFHQLGVVACEVVDRLVAEFGVSTFEPVAFELKIDNDGEVPTYDIPLSDGMIKIKGSVDRVDVMKTEKGENFVRVIDYKSGGKLFDLNEVFSGLNMQMLIYLFAIWKSGFREYKKVKPAGILYMPVKAPDVKIERDEDENSVMSKKQKEVRMSGMVLDDSRVVYAMDSRSNGVIIPAKIKNGECTDYVISLKKMQILMKRVEKIISEMGENLHNGIIPVMPAKPLKTASSYSDVCKYCDYHDVCGADDYTPKNEIESLKFDESLKKLGGEDDA